MPPKSLCNLSQPAGPNQSGSFPGLSDGGVLPAAAAAAEEGTPAATAQLVIRCVIPSLYLLLITVGLLGNIVLVKVFVTNSAMRSAPNIFISNLVAGDVLLLLTCDRKGLGKQMRVYNLVKITRNRRTTPNYIYLP